MSIRMAINIQQKNSRGHNLAVVKKYSRPLCIQENFAEFGIDLDKQESYESPPVSPYTKKSGFFLDEKPLAQGSKPPKLDLYKNISRPPVADSGQ